MNLFFIFSVWVGLRAHLSGRRTKTNFWIISRLSFMTGACIKFHRFSDMLWWFWQNFEDFRFSRSQNSTRTFTWCERCFAWHCQNDHKISFNDVQLRSFPRLSQFFSDLIGSWNVLRALKIVYGFKLSFLSAPVKVNWAVIGSENAKLSHYWVVLAAV